MDLIIGGGISGLSYAMFCHSDGYLLLEKENEIGGYCRTTRRNGFTWDYSGHFFHFQNPEIKDLIMKEMDENSVLKVNKCTHIKYKDLLVDFPFQKNIHQLSKEEFIECLVDLFSVDNESYTTFKEMLYSKFGHSIADKFLIPYNEKLYACDLDRLDKDAMGRFFPYADKNEIVRNFRITDNTSYNGSFLYPKGGAIQYVEAINRKLKTENIVLGKQVVKIFPSSHIAVLNSGEKIHYDNLVSTIPFPMLLDMLEMDYDSNIYSWNKVLVFNLGFNKKGPNSTDHWIYFPEKKYSFYRVGFYDNILNQDRTSLYVELGFDKNEIINPNEYLGQVLHDLKLTGCIDENQILIDYESIIMNPAYVHITAESMEDVSRKKEELAQYNIYSIGRYGSWTYCSIEDNIKEARALAQKLKF